MSALTSENPDANTPIFAEPARRHDEPRPIGARDVHSAFEVYAGQVRPLASGCATRIAFDHAFTGARTRLVDQDEQDRFHHDVDTDFAAVMIVHWPYIAIPPCHRPREIVALTVGGWRA